MQEILSKALVDAVDSTKSPGAVAYVGNARETFLHEAYGFREVTPERLPATVDTIYDLASLTKVLATTTAILLLREDGLIDPDKPVTAYLPIPAFGRFTLRHLLTHTSGLVSGRPYYKEVTSLTEMLQRYAELGIAWEPGTRRRYSDVGFVILGRIVELVSRDRLDAFCTKRIFRPLDMKHTVFNPPAEWASQCAATELCAWRKKVVIGQVHDENAYAVGGVAGHAGLFSTAGDIALYCRALLGGKLLKPATVVEMTRLGQTPCHPWQGLGWWLDPWSSGSDGYLLSRAAFGHSGWTGTCVWMDPETSLFAILLGNTCHPSREKRSNGDFRRTFFNGVAQAFYPNVTTTHTGLDRLIREDFEALRGKRVAVLTHQAAVDQLGRPILDVFALAPDIKVKTLYSPEHGIRGQAEAGETVKSENGVVPVVSLMGERKAPSPEELAQIDCFVIDLQDVGSRYYTYPATMRDCLEACWKAGKTAVVLDRPNPVGGAMVEGPVAAKSDSPVCWGAVPVRHGMTMGELAMLFAKRSAFRKRAELTVLSLDNWQRQRLFAECSLPWIPPSPNIPTPETALVYVGMCLFEGANVNEGRGTETPFHVIGAPWLDSERVIGAVRAEDRPGCTLEAVEYTPKSIAGKASNPRYKDERCRGIRIQVTAPREVRAFRLAVALLAAIRRIHAADLKWEPAGFLDTLAGSGELRLGIERGEEPAALVEQLEAKIGTFVKNVPRLYT